MKSNIKKGIAFIVAAVLICVVFIGVANKDSYENKALADGMTTITLQIGSPNMTVNGAEQPIDEEGTVPVIVNERTLVPIRAIIESMGGTVGWDGEKREVSLDYNGGNIRLVIDSTKAFYNGGEKELDTAPAIINERTMLPIRFIAESFGFEVSWDGDTQTVTISGTEKAQAPQASAKGILVAYFTAAENGEYDAISEATVTTYNGKEMGGAESIADMIAEKTGADKFSIQTVKKFPTKYEDLADAAKAQQDAKELPELATHIDDIARYDTIFVVYPAWWYDMPQVMYSFFDEYDFSGKTIIPAITHEGNRRAGFDSIKRVEPDANVITDGFAVTSSKAADAKADVDKWLNSFDLP